MGVEPFLITSTLNAVLAQRLVRRLCAECRTPYTPAPAVVASFSGASALDGDPVFYQAAGCAACDQSGFRGRVAVTELLIMDDSIATLIIGRAEVREIEQAARAGTMRSLLEDGYGKVTAGLTTVDEILRVASGD